MTRSSKNRSGKISQKARVPQGFAKCTSILGLSAAVIATKMRKKKAAQKALLKITGSREKAKELQSRIKHFKFSNLLSGGGKEIENTFMKPYLKNCENLLRTNAKLRRNVGKIHRGVQQLENKGGGGINKIAEMIEGLTDFTTNTDSHFLMLFNSFFASVGIAVFAYFFVFFTGIILINHSFYYLITFCIFVTVLLMYLLYFKYTAIFSIRDRGFLKVVLDVVYSMVTFWSIKAAVKNIFIKKSLEAINKIRTW